MSRNIKKVDDPPTIFSRSTYCCLYCFFPSTISQNANGATKYGRYGGRYSSCHLPTYSVYQNFLCSFWQLVAEVTSASASTQTETCEAPPIVGSKSFQTSVQAWETGWSLGFEGARPRWVRVLPRCRPMHAFPAHARGAEPRCSLGQVREMHF